MLFPVYRGYGAMTLMLDWGLEDELVRVENGDFINDNLEYFWLKLGLFYRLNGGGNKKIGTLGEATCSALQHKLDGF